jgi:dolichol-phosphate mannosyltransferase
MSGFFMLRRSLLDEVVHSLSGLGFKILLDIIASAHRPIVFREVPFVFRNRLAGQSKLDGQIMWEYLMLLADKIVGSYVPVRFISFTLIGSVGVAVHLGVLTLLFRMSGVDFAISQTVATVVTMAFNYSLNNLLTYSDRRRRGFRWVTGLLSFSALCSIGAISNVGIATYLFNHRSQWVLAAIAGVTLGAVWNYAVTSVYTWGRPKGS